jgi:hypothetical protein
MALFDRLRTPSLRVGSAANPTPAGTMRALRRVLAANQRRLDDEPDRALDVQLLGQLSPGEDWPKIVRFSAAAG